MKKKIFVMFMALFITTNTVMVSNVEASGLEELLLLPSVVGGVTIGGAIALALTVVAVGYGVTLTVENWDDITADFKNTATGSVLPFMQSWLDKLENEAISVADGFTKLRDVIDAGLEWNPFDYFIPKDKSIVMDLNPDVESYIADFLCNYYEYSDLTPGSYGSPEIAIRNYFTQNNYTLTADGFFDLENIMILNSKYSLYGENGCVVVASNSNISWKFRTIMDFNFMVLIGSDVFVYDYTNGIYNGVTHYPSSTVDAFAIKTREVYLATELSNFDVYSDYTDYGPIQGIRMEYESDINEYIVSPSGYSWDHNGEIAQQIALNGYMANELDRLGDLGKVDTIEKVAQAVKEADIEAEKNYTDVTSLDLEGGEAEPLPWDILGLLKQFAEWLFVPSSTAVTDFTTEAENIMDRNAGLLTYPLTLVIRFLQEILSLGVTDCILNMPQIVYKGNILFAGTSFNFTQFVKKSEFSTLYNIYFSITDFIMIIAVVNLAIKKGDEFFYGGK